MADLTLEVEYSELTEYIKRFREKFNPAKIESRVMELAVEAGHILLSASVKACVEAIYDHNYDVTPGTPFGIYGDFGGNAEERTGQLLAAHRLTNGGFDQTVDIDPDEEAVPSHSGREFVIDYAAYVHDGYTQWVMGKNTGTFHPGRFWFDVAEAESFPVIFAFAATAFSEMIAGLL